MPRQVEPETQIVLDLRSTQRRQLLDAVNSGDFVPVSTTPYAGQPAGFPVTKDMEAKLRGAYDDADTKLVADDQISLQQQINTMEALRRAETTRSQTRKQMLSHLQFELTQAAAHDAATLLVFTGMDKVTPKTP